MLKNKGFGGCVWNAQWVFSSKFLKPLKILEIIDAPWLAVYCFGYVTSHNLTPFPKNGCKFGVSQPSRDNISSWASDGLESV